MCQTVDTAVITIPGTGELGITIKQEIKTEPEEIPEVKDHSAVDKVDFQEEADEEDDAVPMEEEDSWNVRVQFEVELACLEDVEALEDRIFNASLQVKVSEAQICGGRGGGGEEMCVSLTEPGIRCGNQDSHGIENRRKILFPWQKKLTSILFPVKIKMTDL